MWCILPIVCPNFLLYSVSTLWSTFPDNWSAYISYFSYAESVLKGVLKLLNFPVRNHSFTSYMMWSVWSRLKPRGDWWVRKFRSLIKYPSWTFISKCSLKNIVSSVNYISLLVVFRTSSVETVRYDNITSENTLM